MGRRIKLKDDTYIDSSAIIHDYSDTFGTRRKLNEVLNQGAKQTLDGEGWYQIATIKTIGGTDFSIGCSAIISVFQSYFYYVPEVHTLLIEASYQGATIKMLNYQTVRNSNVITKYRIVSDDASGSVYRLEAYYSMSKQQVLFVERVSAYTPSVIIETPTLVTKTPSIIYKEIDTAIDPDKPVEIWKQTSWSSMLGNMVQLSLDLTPYKYIEVYFCSYGSGGPTGGNALSSIVKIDLEQPSIYSLSNYNDIDWRYGNAYMYPDLQLMYTSVVDPYCFNGAVMISADKTKLMTTNLGFLNSDFTNNPTSAQYVRAYKILGYK